MIHAPALVADFFKLNNFKIVPGFRSPTDIMLAAGRGEVDFFQMRAGVLRRGIDSGFLKPPIAVIASERKDFYPGVPALPELVELTSQQKQLLKDVEALYQSYSAATLFGPPDIPEDRLEFMREAFTTIAMKDAVVEKLKPGFAGEVYKDVDKRVIQPDDLEDVIGQTLRQWEKLMPTLKQLEAKYVVKE
jgi:tripartite-type tricarboxylate transporter receptor subunit TctC